MTILTSEIESRRRQLKLQQEAFQRGESPSPITPAEDPPRIGYTQVLSGNSGNQRNSEGTQEELRNPSGDQEEHIGGGAVPANLRAQLSAHKDEIIEWLSWPVEAADCRPVERLPPVGQVVSTPRGRGRLVAVLPEFVAVKLFDDPLRLVNFLPCEIEPLRGASKEGDSNARS